MLGNSKVIFFRIFSDSIVYFSSDSFDEIRYEFISDYCLADNNGVTLNGSEFSISSFAFNNFESTSMIYFHCNVNVCNEETEGDGSCDVNCEGGGRRRRTVGAGIDAVQMTVGPIRIEK